MKNKNITEESEQLYLKNSRPDIVNKIASIIEALLFIYGEGASRKEIKKLLKDKKISFFEYEFQDAITLLNMRYQQSSSGLSLSSFDDKLQLSTKAQLGVFFEEMLHPIKRKKLSQAALETLSIIAYKQPVTKSEIEYIRGVKSDRPISILIEAQLIEEQGRLEKIGRPIIYATTEKFLRDFSLESISALPSYDAVNMKLNQEEENI